MTQHRLMLFSGNANLPLSQKIAQHLNMSLSRAVVSTFSDGETMVEILDNVRGRDVFIIQPTCAPTNDHIMELLCMADALRRASAMRITAVMPYFGYARQDRRMRAARVPITAKVVADMLDSVGIARVLTVDLHADQIQGFFYMPVDNVYATTIMHEHIQTKNYHNVMVVSPDIGGVVRARAMAKKLNCDLAIIDKRRPKPNEAQVMNIIGDVRGRTCVLIDDLVDTASTLCQAAAALKAHGAERAVAYCTHAIFSSDAVAKIQTSALDEVVVADAVPLKPDAEACDKIVQLSLSKMLAQVIQRMNAEESISSLFTEVG